MRRAAKVDNNQSAIVQALRSAGCTVLHLHSVGMGAPDLLVGFRGANYLIEVKSLRTRKKPHLLEAQKRWHESWKGQAAVVTSPWEAIKVVLGRTRISHDEAKMADECQTIQSGAKSSTGQSGDNETRGEGDKHG